MQRTVLGQARLQYGRERMRLLSVERIRRQPSSQHEWKPRLSSELTVSLR
jgi:hypothetical protein